MLRRPGEVPEGGEHVRLRRVARVHGLIPDGEVGQSEMPDEFMRQVREVLGNLREKNNVVVHFVGHTDNIGNDQDNLLLSQRRAKAVYDYLMQLGIAGDRLSYKGYGESRPIAGNQSEEGRARNRRTEFVIIEK